MEIKQITKKTDGTYLIDNGHGPNTYHVTENSPELWQACIDFEQENQVGPFIEEIHEIKIDPSFEALNYLNSTDWYVTRKTETGKEIPTEILEARAAAREAI